MRRTAMTLLTATVAGCAAPQRAKSPDPVVVARGAEPEAEVDHMARAGACLEAGDDAGAVPHLAAHLAAYPDAVRIRAYLADLHFKLGEVDQAKRQYARYVRDAAGMSGTAGRHLVHGHTRLMHIAAAREDAFAEALHRGVGLVLLVRQWDAEAAPGTPGLDALTESTLVRAAAALKAAREVNARDPRVHVYLAEVWGRLGQPSAARAAIRTAKGLLPDAALNADERARLARME